MSILNKFKLSSVHVIPLSFLGAILIGTLLLALPVSSAAGTWTPLVDSLFTATTSVCVTGIVVVDTYSYWSLFGQTVILLLIQIGGLGVITVVSTLMLIAHKRFSLSERLMLRDAMNLDSIGGLLAFLSKVIRGTFLVELAGAFLYMFAFVPRFGLARGIRASVFNAVSAFCNAGMDILGPDSLIPYRSDPLVLTVTMALIVMGGLGYVVWFDVMGESFARRGKEAAKSDKELREDPLKKIPEITDDFSADAAKYGKDSTGKAGQHTDDFEAAPAEPEINSPKGPLFKHLTEHTKLVLTLTLILIAAGTAVILAAEYNNVGTIGELPLPLKLLNSLFESVTFRMAGFATLPQKSLTDVSCLAAYFMMFIGGSPIGTAGGVKTTTFYFYIMNITSYIRGQNSARVYKRSVSAEQMMKATAIVEVSMGTVLVLTLLLSATNPVGLTDALFEVMSACATVGLTRGVTPLLNTAGKLIIIAGMYLGRIGPISMALFFAGGRKEESPVHFPEGNFFIG